jgi:protein-S-isoprenylcysteine O-methyltransferase Ste14
MEITFMIKYHYKLSTHTEEEIKRAQKGLKISVGITVIFIIILLLLGFPFLSENDSSIPKNALTIFQGISLLIILWGIMCSLFFIHDIVEDKEARDPSYRIPSFNQDNTPFLEIFSFFMIIVFISWLIYFIRFQNHCLWQ